MVMRAIRLLGFSYQGYRVIRVMRVFMVTRVWGLMQAYTISTVGGDMLQSSGMSKRSRGCADD